MSGWWLRRLDPTGWLGGSSSRWAAWKLCQEHVPACPKSRWEGERKEKGLQCDHAPWNFLLFPLCLFTRHMCPVTKNLKSLLMGEKRNRNLLNAYCFPRTNLVVPFNLQFLHSPQKLLLFPLPGETQTYVFLISKPYSSHWKYYLLIFLQTLSTLSLWFL